jgi:hypothetical protein
VFSDAAGSHITPTVFAFTVVNMLVPGPPDPLIVAVAVLWATVLGVKGILYHQITDRANDEAAGVVTFAGAFDFHALAGRLTRYNLLIELPVSVALVVAVAGFLPLAVPALAMYLALESLKSLLGFEFALSSDGSLRRRSVPFANEMSYTLWLPLAGAAQVALMELSLAWLPFVHCALFWEQGAVQLRDARGLGNQLQMRLAHFWSR